MAKNEVVFYEVVCVKAKKKFYARYDFAADDSWVLTYGQKAIDSSENNNGNFRKIDISKTRIGPQYRCPYCGNRGYVLCGRCGKLTCKGPGKFFECAHCGRSGEVSGESIGEMSGMEGRAQ